MDGAISKERYLIYRNKLVLSSTLIMVLGILFGACLITIWTIKVSPSNLESATGISRKSIEEKIDVLEEEISVLEDEKRKEFNSNGYSDEYYEFAHSIDSRKGEITILNVEIQKIESGYNDSLQRIEKNKYAPYLICGIFVSITSILISVIMYLFIKKGDTISLKSDSEVDNGEQENTKKEE